MLGGFGKAAIVEAWGNHGAVLLHYDNIVELLFDVVASLLLTSLLFYSIDASGLSILLDKSLPSGIFYLEELRSLPN